MFEQLLSLLLTSHHLSGRGLILKKGPSPLQGLYPGTRLGLQRMYVSLFIATMPLPSLTLSLVSRRCPLAKLATPYRPGDLGLVPP